MSAYDQFSKHMAQVNDLCCVLNLLNWDAQTQMPAGGTSTRGSQIGTIARLAQELFISEKTARLLDAVEKEIVDSGDLYRFRAVHQTREVYEMNKRVPIELMAELNAHKPVAQQIWGEAKRAKNFSMFVPALEKMVTLYRRIADAIGYPEHPYDAMLLRYEPSMTASRLQALFAQLREFILPILERAVAQGDPRTDFLERDYSPELQRQFALEVVQQFGFDLNRGRLDVSAHPFEISITRNDVRITTRYFRNFLPAAVFGVFHESGHALYEQSVDPEIVRSPLTTDLLDLYAVAGTSYGLHESQSRLWENLIGRSRTFWKLHYPRLLAVFPEQLSDVTVEEFYRAINRVKPSFIRVEADEVTYNLHIMLRVEIEMALMDGSLQPKDVPGVWAEKSRKYLGITPPDDSLGALQDIHWAAGNVGSFPGYTVGNVMSAQFFAAAKRSLPSLEQDLAVGNYQSLLEWLKDNIYRFGRTYGPEELLERATGSRLDVADYRAYLTGKFGDLFPEK
jgi:carboxypeptidase Taq